MVAELGKVICNTLYGCSLAKISMVAEQKEYDKYGNCSCSLAKISMVAELISNDGIYTVKL